MNVSRSGPGLLLAVILAGVAACNGAGSGGGDDAAGRADAVLRRGNGGEPGTLDPARAEDVHAFNVLADLYEGLVAHDADGRLVPAAADSWGISADGLVYTFRLRREGRWSNGERVVAADFVAAFRRVLAPATGSTYAYLLYPIRNAAEVGAGDLPPEALAVTATDPGTLVIDLEAPAAHFLSVLALAVAYPEWSGQGFGAARHPEPAAFVGNGPYVLDSREPGHRLRLRRNPLYRQADEVAIEFVDYFAVVDPLTELNMYRSGEIDITATVPGAQFESLRAERPGELVVAPALAVYYLAFDLSEPPFDDRSLRQALSMAIDRDRLVRLLGRGEAPAWGFVPDGVADYEPARYDWRELESNERQDAARRLYREAGYTSAEPLQATLVYDAGDDVHETIALAVGAMWREVLGVELSLDKREWKYFLSTRDQRSEWDLMRFAWSGDYNHPRTFLEILHSQSPQNLPRYSSPAYDTAFAAAEEATAARQQFAGAEAAMLADYPVVPLYFFVSKHLVRPGVTGFRPNVLDRHPSRYLRLDAAARPR
ncbi:MAG: peptide ABC transporter substrate-binding protein [Gammaproteobacteria bacterium]|nr:peptide ABC transporter substrate-binding protein [Gammaproteobacteria bacterium]MDH4253156.1 peptide ABC transporter substrate-binding protein [Gammaproteobacteria bacterium]MDH5308482.1 peptide ABC transporter substrate-binding protein [Gammaproteobacteria bacterium]